MNLRNSKSVTMGKIEFRPGELHDALPATRAAGFGVPVYMTHHAFVNAKSTGAGWLTRLVCGAHEGMLTALRTQVDTTHMEFSLLVPSAAPLDFVLSRATAGGRSALVVCAR